MIVNNIQELNKFVGDLLKKGYKKFLLKGDLGVGKTEFTKQLAKHIGISNISSPTYTYINIYQDKFLHGDFYRIESQEDFLNLGILDQIGDYEYISIEWPRFEELYVDSDFVKIQITNKNSIRKFDIIK